ncbi:MAG: biotin/lipoyl-containing protein [Armatimonadota bacterium]
MTRSEFLFQGERIVLQATREGSGWRVVLPDGSEHFVQSVQAHENGLLVLHMPAGVRRLHVHQEGDEIALSYQGHVYRFRRAIGRRGATHHSTAEGMLTAPMPGLIRKVLVQVGERVEAGQPLVVLEAMKTEQTLRAPYAGMVQALRCREGEVVQEGVILVEIVEAAALQHTAHPIAPCDEIAHAPESEPGG